jgi:hypothetical protein
VQPARHPRIDCFYVYPTVFDQATGNANLNVDPEERSIALYQAVAYSGRCEYANGANALQISGLPGAPTLHPVPEATWGLHLVDAKIALGNLVDVVRVQGFVYELLRRFPLGSGPPGLQRALLAEALQRPGLELAGGLLGHAELAGRITH